MSEIRINLDRQNETAGESVLKNVGVKGLVTSDLESSEVISTLSKRVRVAKVQTEKFDYLAPKLFSKNLVFDGMIDVDYTELQVTSTDDPYAPAKITDFNGETNKAIRKTFAANTQSNVKTKILKSSIMNFKTTPSDGITEIYKSTKNINKAQAKKWAEQIWTVFKETGSVVDITGIEDVAATGDSINKIVYETMLNFQTTRKGHLGVGENGVITDNAGNSVEPSMKFESNEFHVIVSPKYQANTKYDGDKVFLNYEGRPYEVASYNVIDFANAEEIPEGLRAEFAKDKVILVHKESVYGIQDWEGTGIANSGKLYDILHNYMKQDAIRIEDSPIVRFSEVTPEGKKS